MRRRDKIAQRFYMKGAIETLEGLHQEIQGVINRVNADSSIDVQAADPNDPAVAYCRGAEMTAGAIADCAGALKMTAHRMGIKL